MEVPNVYVKIQDNDNKIIENVIIDLTFKSDHKNNFTFFLTSKHFIGEYYVLKKSEILKEAKEICNYGIMDFHPIESVFDGNIEVTITSVLRLNEMLYLMRDYNTKETKEFRNEVKNAIKYTKALEESGMFNKLKVTCIAEPPIATFHLLT